MTSEMDSLKRPSKLRLATSRMKKRNTTANSLTNPRPYKVWKEHFIQDHGCERTMLWREVVVSSIPHILLNAILIAYIFFGVGLFNLLDPGAIKNGNLNETVYFVFTTIATIGYGGDAPSTQTGEYLCIAYSAIGVPLIFMVLANNGQFIVDAYWIARNSYLRGTEEWNGEMPLRVTFYLLSVHILLGGFIYSRWIGDLTYFDAVYYSFISVTTIGFGDIIVYPRTEYQMYAHILFLSVGIIFLTTLMGSMSNYLQKLHYMGRQFSGVSDVEVWFGGEAMTVRELITMVADEFETSPELLHYVLNDLDSILEVAMNKDTEEAVEHLRRQGEIAKKMSFVNLESAPGAPQRKITVTRLYSDPSSPSSASVSFNLLDDSDERSGSIHRSLSRVSRNSTPLERVPSNSSIHEAVRRDSDKSLHALGIVYHAIQKRDTVRRSLSFRRHRPASQNSVRAKKILPAYPAVV